MNFGEPSYTAEETGDDLDHDDDDEDYVLEYEELKSEVLESDAEASKDETEENLQKFTFAEFAQWIQREGGIAKHLELVHTMGTEFENEE